MTARGLFRAAALLAAAGRAAGAAVPAAGIAVPGAGSSCVTCHAKLTEEDQLVHTYSDWAKSVHAIKGVGCERCHGGDPAKAGKAEAHAGLKGPDDPASPVSYTRVHETCGRCHAAELRAFRQSKHYRELTVSRHGPTCVSCHGSMANYILDPRSMDTVCTVCHRRPTLAYKALLSLNRASTRVRELKDAVARARAAKMDPGQAATVLDAVSVAQALALADWHTFRIKEVLAGSRDVAKRAEAARNELAAKGVPGVEPR